MEQIAMRFDNVGVTVAGNRLLTDVTGTVHKGRTVALIGPSGAGKSTLLSLCNLLRTPSAGSVYVEEKEVREWPVQALRQKVGMVFQTATMFPGTVEDNLAYGLRLHGQSLQNPEALLENVGLSTDLLHKPAAELSGGQKQRVALGRTLAMRPDILLLDEVTSALDIHAKHDVETTILDVRDRFKTTLFWVTHDLDQARRVADEVWFMAGGSVIEQGPATSLFEHPNTPELKAFLSEEEEETK
ncbi:ABC transporter ATP-binding protein [Alicyclobacillus acidiphilus]|uniref:ABC transporter ATP-binding protein n=1 Tax=Alicyclobacillus acidiphilus TaxID=182455 RepID=UPI00082A2CFA|nr:ATP-binding cassette domain-containing protein [Alicyclobacillus acidiphilus]